MNIQKASMQMLNNLKDIIPMQTAEQDTENNTNAAENKKSVEESVSAMIFDTGIERSSDNTKMNQIMTKFYSGKKLSMDELNFLTQKAPELAEKVRRIMMEREQLEKAMKASKTKTQVMMHSISALKNIDPKNADPYETMARVNQLSDAIHSYMASKEYQDKPLDEAEAAKRKKHSKKDKSKEAENTLTELLKKKDHWNDILKMYGKGNAEATFASNNFGKPFGTNSDQDEDAVSELSADAQQDDVSEKSVAAYNSLGNAAKDNHTIAKKIDIKI